MKKKKIYITVKNKFILSVIFIVAWSIICTILEKNWWCDLTARFGSVLATFMIIGLAFLPGVMISMTISGILLDHPNPKPIKEDELEDITILVAAYNEEQSIYDTLKSLSQQNYSKKIYVKVIDNNSHDGTKNEILRAQKDFQNLNIEYLFEKKQGKFAALNCGLNTVKTKYVLTIDADTYLYKDAILTLANHIIQENKNKKVGAVAGTVLVRNSRANLLTKMQEWEYFLSMANIKRGQGLFQSTLVAQGAFSIYNTALVKKIGGWSDSIGEDIVLTWQILNKGYRTQYEEHAIAFTNVPTELKIFVRQRARWARGMLEGFRHFDWKSKSSFYTKFFVICDYFLFAIDFSVTFFWIPGLFAFLFFHDNIIIGPTTVLLFPFTLLMFFIMYIIEYKHVFKPLGLKVRKHFLSLIIYILTYSMILSPACIWGYTQEILGTKRKWK